MDKRKKNKPPCGLGEDICHVSKEQAENALKHSKKIKELKCLLNIKTIEGKDIENS